MNLFLKVTKVGEGHSWISTSWEAGAGELSLGVPEQLGNIGRHPLNKTQQ